MNCEKHAFCSFCFVTIDRTGVAIFPSGGSATEKNRFLTAAALYKWRRAGLLSGRKEMKGFPETVGGMGTETVRKTARGPAARHACVRERDGVYSGHGRACPGRAADGMPSPFRGRGRRGRGTARGKNRCFYTIFSRQRVQMAKECAILFCKAIKERGRRP